MNHCIDVCSGDCKKARGLIEKNWGWEPDLYPRRSFGSHRPGNPDFYRIKFENQDRKEKAQEAFESAGINCFEVK
jgi:hypothetical protein